jgi:hypothetical protein
MESGVFVRDIVTRLFGSAGLKTYNSTLEFDVGTACQMRYTFCFPTTILFFGRRSTSAVTVAAGDGVAGGHGPQLFMQGTTL